MNYVNSYTDMHMKIIVGSFDDKLLLEKNIQ